MTSSFSLLLVRRFAPMFGCTCGTSFNDNFFKNALIILLTYRLAAADGMQAETLISLASAAFIIPFFIFSGIAGNLADRVPRHRLVQKLKLTECLLCILALPALLSGHVWTLLALLALSGTQSAFYGPVKYAILPSLLHRDELIAGNGLTEAGTFLFILFGTMLGGLLILHPIGPWMVGGIMIVSGFAGIALSRMVPAVTVPAGVPLHASLNVWRTTWDMLRVAVEDRRIFCAILGISWFWAIGTTYLTQLPAFTKEVLRANEEVVTFFFALFSIGIGIGSLLCNRILKGEVRMTYVPWAMLGVAFFGFDIWFCSSLPSATPAALEGFKAFIADASHWRLIVDLALLAMCGGVFIVPLYTLLQTESHPDARARVIASNNVVNALVIALMALGAAGAYAAGWHVRDVFLVAALLNLPVVWALWRYVK